MNCSRLAMVVLILSASLQAQQSSPASKPARESRANKRARLAREQLKMPPDMRDVSYGSHERNVFDFWKADSDKPTPLVVFIHGGGNGDKSRYYGSKLMALCLENGLSASAINYRRLSDEPFPAAMVDSARAIQFFRYKAKDLNIDPQRVAAVGGSAGAGISLWLGLHDDFADPNSDDPLCRQSTRLSCVCALYAQTSYDPRLMKKVLGQSTWPYDEPLLRLFYGLQPDELYTPRAQLMYEQASPINFASADDPPIFMYHRQPKGEMPPETDVEAYRKCLRHHWKFGEILKSKLDPLGVECIARRIEDYKVKKDISKHLNRDIMEFLLAHLR